METVNDLKGDKEETSIARLYMRITGLGYGKRPHDVTYDDVETLLQGRELISSTVTSLTASA
ncbi:MAG: hypothetical protein ACFFCD_13165 [Promethearchaeota archaeon]